MQLVEYNINLKERIKTMMNKRKVASAFVGVAGLGLLAGCNDGETSAEGEIEKLTIVQMPDEGNPDMGGKNDDFKMALEEELGIEVEELEGAEYSVGIEAMRSGSLDVLLVSPMSYYQAKKVADAEPLVTTTSMGEEPYQTVFVVNGEDEETQTLADLEGKTFAFVDPASSSGYMFPKSKIVNDLDLDPDQLENPGFFFDTVSYSGGHDATAMGVAMGDYEAGAVAGQLIPRLIEAGLIEEDALRAIDKTEVIPNALYVVRPDLPEDIKEQLKDFYINYEDEEYFEATYGSPDVRFIEASEEDYEVVNEMIETLNLEDYEEE